MKRIAIFASGSGTNAENIINYFRHSHKARVKAVFCNNKNAGVIERCKQLDVPCFVFDKEKFYNTGYVDTMLKHGGIDLIVLAGFLLLVPERLIRKFPNRIINIHPALLPGHGGKGFYGSAVHQSVLKAGSKKSGITIHYVNEHFDEGEIIFQMECNIEAGETAESLAKKVHELEYKYFPEVIEDLVDKL